ncbi:MULTISPECIES: DUF2254 domain-containing protein [unclassified Iodidimonas]|jgi:uncharacterized membrane protein|uniref:DUF2254 domain-containing protein n=1 Tax=unclassified Iodidimonas TaxID=2626145 RepID=UPI002482936A|nr:MULTISPECIES: DUF2254 domain-containing protein [unclassified Iodidimonas]
MIGKWHWHLQQIMRRIWVRAVSYALLGVLTALVSVPLGPMIPQNIGATFGADAVDRVLGILATSMLAVTTFSLSIMVTTLSAVSNAATPRVARLLHEDKTSQIVLASFIGSFLYSIVGIITLQAGAYDDGGRLLLFLVTIAVIAMVVGALLRWISHLMEFGRMSDAINRVERAAIHALQSRSQSPGLGGCPYEGPPPDDSLPVSSPLCGYVQHIDMERLAEFASTRHCRIWLSVLPGSYCYPGRPLFSHSADDLSEEEINHLSFAFTIGKVRNYDQDPRFGVIVLSEIASRALSPSVNDPGTAIEVLGRIVSVLLEYDPEQQKEPKYPDLFVPPIKPIELLEDAFLPIARDGAGLIEVQIRLQKSLQALRIAAPDIYKKAALIISAKALDHAKIALAHPEEKALLDSLVQDTSD